MKKWEIASIRIESNILNVDVAWEKFRDLKKNTQPDITIHVLQKNLGNYSIEEYEMPIW